ncbi:MAG: hypothetical protein QOE90_2243 [Thermoplasmata archaeon]|nr:hypothetical protein [Thermoplasmata archaeon]
MTITEMVEALLVFDEPILNSRYHGMLARFPEGRMREDLVRLPAQVLASARVSQAAADAWTRSPASTLGGDFLAWGERSLLDAFLSLTESQLRVLAYAARAAPTSEIEAGFTESVKIHRQIASTLREALSLLSNHATHGEFGGLRAAQEEAPAGNLRAQLDAAIRAAESAGHALRQITVSPTGLRHLRDQGSFDESPTTIHETPIVVDFAWDAPAFALQSFDAIPLEEIIHDGESGRRAALFGLSPKKGPAGPTRRA